MDNTVKNGDNISVHYKGTLENGEKFDSSYDRGQTLDFTAGAGQMIKGFDAAVIGMKKGEKKKITIPAKEAYGEKDTAKIIEVPSTQFADYNAIKVGIMINGGGAVGKVIEKTTEFAKIDFNHQLAGQTLVFEIELVSINE